MNQELGLAGRLSRLPPEKRQVLERMLKDQGVDVDHLFVRRRTGSDPPPLSFAQQRLWFLDQLQTGAAYNVPLALRLSGDLDVRALEASLNEVVRRHEALRTTFPAVEGRPVQALLDELVVPLAVEDLETGEGADPEALVRRRADEEAARVFDLARGPLLRATLLRLGAAEHVLLLTMHHIVSDGWSVGVLFRELTTLYGAFTRGEPSPLADLEVQYPDYAVWQRQWLRGEVLERQLTYWKGRLHELPSLQLPTDRPRPAVASLRGASHLFTAPAALARGLKSLGRREGASLFMTLLAAFKVLLCRYSGQADIVVGSPVSNRNRREVEGLIGFFVNSLALRTDLSGDPSFREALARVRETALGAYDHQDLPFEKLVEELQPERDLSRNPLFQTSFALLNAPVPPLALGRLSVSPLVFEPKATRFDLSLNLWEGGAELHGVLTYCTELFEPSTIARMAGHFGRLLEGIVSDPDRRISDLPLLGEEELGQLLVGWNATERGHGTEACLHELVELQVGRTPHAVAAAFEDETLTYAELDRRANQLAHHLRALGVGPEVRVGVFVDRSLELPVALLGTLKAGGAYVPLDPSYPRARLSWMLRDARVHVLLTRDALAPALPGHAAPVLRLDADWPLIGRAAEGRPASGVRPENLAYVMYTSGSTGEPRGVAVPHAAIRNHMLWMQSAFPLSDDDRVLQKTTLNFDASVWECFAPLLAGARLVLARPDGQKDRAYLVEAIRRHGVTVLKVVPSLLRSLLGEPAIRDCTSLRLVLCGGEALSAELQRQFADTLGAELHNLYGPTEAAVDVTSWPARSPMHLPTVPIGRPIHNTRAYVLDARGRPVPVGVAGELHVAGASLARGYLDQPALTAERFVPDPFGVEPGGRLYRTGDLVRWLADGAIEFLGRRDQQVKIRGFRIELGEIAAVLERHPDVSEAVVVGGGAPEDMRLVAYVVPEEGCAARPAELRAHLREALPDYMVPSSFVALESMPLGPSGKVDRRALPAPDSRAADTGAAYVAPRTDVERVLVAIWQELLGFERIGVHDDFFDLGGHSLLATQLLSRVRATFDVSLPLRQLFESPSVAGLAAAMVEDPELRARAEGNAEIVLRIMTMSEQEAQRMLEQESTSRLLSEAE